MPTIDTDGKEGYKILSQEDGVCNIQISNTSAFNVYLCSGEKNQSYQDRSIIILPGQQWPTTGPTMWYGDLVVWCDNHIRIPYIKSLTISKDGMVRH